MGVEGMGRRGPEDEVGQGRMEESKSVTNELSFT